MKRIILALLMVFVILVVSGCGGGSSPTPSFVSNILSNPLLTVTSNGLPRAIS